MHFSPVELGVIQSAEIVVCENITVFIVLGRGHMICKKMYNFD